MKILRSISFALSEVIYTLIPTVYDIFKRLATHQFFTNAQIREISNNIYILVSVCMLFALGVKLINTIVNPDLMDNKDKGTGKSFINALIAVVLISITPFAFQTLYDVQATVIEKGLIEKIVFGMDPSKDYKPGQVIAGYTFSAFCYPNHTVTSMTIANSGQDLYNKTISEDINNMSALGDNINTKIDGEWELNYNILLSPITGGYVLYQLILMCIDIALRSIKLGLLQLIAPLVICAYIFSGKELLSRYIKEIVSTYVLLFIKIATITFTIYALYVLPEFFDNLKITDNSDDSWVTRAFIRAAVVIALLQLAKKLPEIINSIFGTKIDTSGGGGISGRLAGMAGVGGVAQKAWDSFRRHPLQSAAKPVGAVAGIGANMVNRARATGQQLRNAAANTTAGTTHGRWSTAFRGAAALVGGAAGVLGGAATSVGAGRRGWQNGLRAPGAETKYYQDTHQEGSTFRGRLQDRVTSSLGFGTRQSRQEEADKYINFPVNGVNRRMTFEELQARASANSKFTQAQNDIKSQIDAEINLADSGIELYHGTTMTRGTATIHGGNKAQMLSQIESLKANGGADAADIADLERAVNAEFDHEAEVIQNQIMHTGNVARLSGGRLATASNSLNTITDLLDDNADLMALVQANNGGVALGRNGNGVITFDTDFRRHARNAVTGDTNAIQRAVARHDQQIEARKTTATGRDMAASHNSVQNLHNNGGGTGGGNGGH